MLNCFIDGSLEKSSSRKQPSQKNASMGKTISSTSLLLKQGSKNNKVVSKETHNLIPIEIIVVSDYKNWLTKQNDHIIQWLNSTGFRSEPAFFSLIPGSNGEIQKVIVCVDNIKNFWCVGNLAICLPEGNYYYDNDQIDYEKFAIAWGLGAYQFIRYLKPKRLPAKLYIPSERANKNDIENIISSIYSVRDLINIPTEDLGPQELGNYAAKLSKELKADCKQIVGDNLLKQNFPMIHAVGRASDDAPRLIDLRWGNKKHKKITLVGKGVCFDSGGLSIKNCDSMLLMKKDMGGAAHALGLAQMIIKAKLPIHLRVLIPAVENVISGNAYRPGDILKSRKGITVEITNTDAEGRVVLADALTEAVSENPELLIDLSTLTGAARIALGTDIPVFFSNQDKLAEDLTQIANQEHDYIWRLPLHAPYRELLCTPFADIMNSTLNGYAGAITAALFLKEFVPDSIPWLHFDMMAWNLRPRLGRPQGGEAMALRALFSYIRHYAA